MEFNKEIRFLWYNCYCYCYCCLWLWLWIL